MTCLCGLLLLSAVSVAADEADALQAQAIAQYHTGNSAAGLRLATEAYRIAPAEPAIQFAYSIGLLQTQQNKRLIAEGLDFLKVDALDALGRRDEAFELAYELASDGSIGNLFTLFNRADRSHDLVKYIEQHWTDLDALAADHPHGGTGYGLMVQVALAYSRTGNSDRFEHALSMVGNVMSTLSSEGVDNFVFMLENAAYRVLAGNNDAAIAQLEEAVERGLRGNPRLAWSQPVFEALAADQRFIALRAVIADKVNEQRRILELDPLLLTRL